MGLLGTIVSTIFHHANATPTASPGTSAAPAAPAHDTSAAPPKATMPAPSSPSSTSASSPAASAAPVDIEAVLTKLAAEHHQRLDWRHSIVDLLKVLNLDSSLAARKQLAAELHYTGDTNDSAKMNIWLHKEVIAELEKNGGKVPDDLKKH